jgi:acetylglutamate kinase
MPVGASQLINLFFCRIIFGPFLHDKELSVHDKGPVAIRQQQIVLHDSEEKEKERVTSSHKMELEERVVANFVESLCSKLSAAKSGVKTCTVCHNCRFHSFS